MFDILFATYPLSCKEADGPPLRPLIRTGLVLLFIPITFLFTGFISDSLARFRKIPPGPREKFRPHHLPGPTITSCVFPITLRLMKQTSTDIPFQELREGIPFITGSEAPRLGTL